VFHPGLLLNFNGIHLEGENENYWKQESGVIWGTGGVSYGAFVTSDLGRYITGAFELRYVRKGGLYEYSNDYGQRDFENLKLRYLEFPILVGYKGNEKLKFESGIAFAKLIYAEILYEELTMRLKKPDAGNFKTDDISWIGNVKYRITKGNNLFAGFRFSYSLLSIHRDYKLYNMDFGLELNYVLF